MEKQKKEPKKIEHLKYEEIYKIADQLSSEAINQLLLPLILAHKQEWGFKILLSNFLIDLLDLLDEDTQNKIWEQLPILIKQKGFKIFKRQSLTQAIERDSKFAETFFNHYAENKDETSTEDNHLLLCGNCHAPLTTTTVKYYYDNLGRQWSLCEKCYRETKRKEREEYFRNGGI